MSWKAGKVTLELQLNEREREGEGAITLNGTREVLTKVSLAQSLGCDTDLESRGIKLGDGQARS
jgi:hypothetical protein